MVPEKRWLGLAWVHPTTVRGLCYCYSYATSQSWSYNIGFEKLAGLLIALLVTGCQWNLCDASSGGALLTTPYTSAAVRKRNRQMKNAAYRPRCPRPRMVPVTGTRSSGNSESLVRMEIPPVDNPVVRWSGISPAVQRWPYGGRLPDCTLERHEP